mmetsp:Transcript_65641/g.150439  ORF Transcript_65641/g.150439 Transcript_65641/m.150439 type:complete len:217 (+) Transcript_65641:102-752(+)
MGNSCNSQSKSIGRKSLLRQRRGATGLTAVLESPPTAVGGATLCKGMPLIAPVNQPNCSNKSQELGRAISGNCRAAVMKCASSAQTGFLQEASTARTRSESLQKDSTKVATSSLGMLLSLPTIPMALFTALGPRSICIANIPKPQTSFLNPSYTFLLRICGLANGTVPQARFRRSPVRHRCVTWNSCITHQCRPASSIQAMLLGFRSLWQNPAWCM